MYSIFFLHLLMELMVFQITHSVLNASMNNFTYTRICWSLFSNFYVYIWIWNDRIYNYSPFSFLKNCQTISTVASPFCILIKSAQSFSILLILVIQKVMVVVVGSVIIGHCGLTCISLMSLLISLLAVGIPSLKIYSNPLPIL